jgi:hypothetical protein
MAVEVAQKTGVWCIHQSVSRLAWMVVPPRVSDVVRWPAGGAHHVQALVQRRAAADVGYSISNAMLALPGGAIHFPGRSEHEPREDTKDKGSHEQDPGKGALRPVEGFGTRSSEGRMEAKKASQRSFSYKSASAEGENGNTDFTPAADWVTSQLPFCRSRLHHSIPGNWIPIVRSAVVLSKADPILEGFETSFLQRVLGDCGYSGNEMGARNSRLRSVC